MFASGWFVLAVYFTSLMVALAVLSEPPTSPQAKWRLIPTRAVKNCPLSLLSHRWETPPERGSTTQNSLTGVIRWTNVLLYWTHTHTTLFFPRSHISSLFIATSLLFSCYVYDFSLYFSWKKWPDRGRPHAHKRPKMVHLSPEQRLPNSREGKRYPLD